MTSELLASLRLPDKSAKPTSTNVSALQDGLTSVIAEHVASVEPWSFYEVLDEYLGPWGAQGYPIGYGKFYCVLFNSDRALAESAIATAWVKRTTVNLQEPLRDYVVQRFQQGTLASLTEAEFRSTAFEAHPRAYDEGGLLMVVMVDPVLEPPLRQLWAFGNLVAIPGKEFLPWSIEYGPASNATKLD